MKRLIFFAVVLITSTLFICCSEKTSHKYGQSGDNAIQYVVEKYGINSDNIESIEITNLDSLLTEDLLNEKEFKTKADARVENKISDEEFKDIVQEAYNTMHDIYSSWRYGDKIDSLKNLTKYQDAWRMVYTVTVKTKSTANKNIRVIMEKDGLTPKMTEDEFKAMMSKGSIITALIGELNWNW